MTQQRFQLVAEIISDDPAAIEPPLRQLAQGKITETADGFHVEATMTGNIARDLSRQLLSTVRRAQRRTRLRAESTAAGVTHRFFDYVPKGTRPANNSPEPSE